MISLMGERERGRGGSKTVYLWWTFNNLVQGVEWRHCPAFCRILRSELPVLFHSRRDTLVKRSAYSLSESGVGCACTKGESDKWREAREEEEERRVAM